MALRKEDPGNKEIMQDRGGKPSEEDSAELIRQEREERSQYLEEL